MPPRGTYRGIYAGLLDDPDFQRLTPIARHVFLTVRQCQDVGPAAIYRYYLEPIAHRTGWTVKQVQAALAELAEAQWLEYDEAVLWIRNGLRYDPHMNLADPKHRKNVERFIGALPRSRIVLNFCEYYKIAWPFDGPYQGPSMGTPLRERERVREREGNTPPSPPAGGAVADVAALTPQELVALYNEGATDNCTYCDTLRGARLEKVKRYLRLFPDKQWWLDTFAQYHKSAFLSGRVAPSNGHRTFNPDLDWLLSKGKDGTDNCVKVHDGRYADG